MPYITEMTRDRLSEGFPAQTPGELNYSLTQVVLEYLGPDPRYSTYNDAIGALECAKLELYRRMVAPYEDQKKEENGDVYG